MLSARFGCNLLKICCSEFWESGQPIFNVFPLPLAVLLLCGRRGWGFDECNKTVGWEGHSCVCCWRICNLPRIALVLIVWELSYSFMYIDCSFILESFPALLQRSASTFAPLQVCSKDITNDRTVQTSHKWTIFPQGPAHSGIDCHRLQHNCS